MSTTEIDLGTVIVRVPLSLVLTMTEQQRERIEVLVRGFKPVDVSLWRDSWSAGNVMFSLLDERGGTILHGLIEPDGCSHT